MHGVQRQRDAYQCWQPTTMHRGGVCSVALGPVAHGGLAVPAHHGAAGAHDALVHRCLHAVVLLDVQLGQRVVVEHGRLTNVTEGGCVHNVPVRFE